MVCGCIPGPHAGQQIERLLKETKQTMKGNWQEQGFSRRRGLFGDRSRADAGAGGGAEGREEMTCPGLEGLGGVEGQGAHQW